jgi:hypothetical protein
LPENADDGTMKSMADNETNQALVVAAADMATTVAEQGILVAKRTSWKRWALAFGVAAISDAISLFVTIVPPVQWVVDLATAGLLFVILGKRWAILPGLITEAIPGMGIFPIWILVVASILVYDDIRKPRRKLQ